MAFADARYVSIRHGIETQAYSSQGLLTDERMTARVPKSDRLQVTVSTTSRSTAGNTVIRIKADDVVQFGADPARADEADDGRSTHVDLRIATGRRM